MNIGYDAKRAFHNRSGLGNYSRDLIKILSHYYPNNKYFLYTPKKSKISFALNKNTKEVLPKSKFWKFFSLLWRQRAIIKQLKADNIKLFHGLSGELPRGVNKSNIKSIVTIHDLIFVRFPELYNPIDRKIYFNKFKYAAEHANLVIAISEQTKRDIVEFLGIPENKITVIYQGCNKAFKQTYTEAVLNATKKKFNLPDQFILNVGTVEKRKNLLNLVKAIEHIDTHLVVIGNTKSKYADGVKNYINEKKLNTKVSFLKNVNTEELAQIYQLATIFVYPSIFEGFGIPIIEALYSKTAVITSKESCFSEAGGEHSIYIDPLDYKSIETKIIYILENKEIREGMEKKGLEFAQKFNDETIAKAMFSTYKSLL